MIKAAELRAVSTEYEQLSTAFNTFKSKYFAIPGDMTNATLFWGRNPSKCSTDTGTDSANGTCNGNGDGIINGASGASATGERYQIWHQLALAGLITGNYSGIAGTGGDDHAVIGTNTPSSKFPNAGWEVEAKLSTGTADSYAAQYGNALKFASAITDNELDGPVLTPEEAWNIDTKVDDGMPGKGRLIVRFWSTCATSTSNTDYDKPYQLNADSAVCAFYFINAL